MCEWWVVWGVCVCMWVCPSDRETRENGKKDYMGGRGDMTGKR